jgi:hypothetical protein
MPLIGEPTSGRNIGLQLYRAITSAHDSAAAAARENRADAFDEHVDKGVSANLCEALGNLGGASRDRPFDVEFSWALGLPTDVAPRTIAFTGVMARVLHQAGRQLTDLANAGQAQVKGDIRFTGGTLRRSIWVLVTEADYDRAYEVQARGWQIGVRGELVPAQRRLELRPAPSGIQIIRN